MLKSAFTHSATSVNERIFSYIKRKNLPHIIPTSAQLIFFNEADIFSGKKLEEKFFKLDKSLGNPIAYEQFLSQKGRRPSYDIYACFQPFNEATKALYPFLRQLKKQVKKGDHILNLWDRSGWMTSLLAAFFPEQQIITSWEGNKDVLGYKGFEFWTKGLDNINILFCDLNKALPLEDNSIAFTVGLDTFHRFDQAALLKELMRITKDKGAIIFPHVHLSNAEPKPFFERGCKQMHGLDYAEAFKDIEEYSNWKGYIFSEPGLFHSNDIAQSEHIPLISEPDTKDYNALIALLPKEWEGQHLSAFTINDIEAIEECRILINHIPEINLHQQTVCIKRERMGGAVGHLLDRHPVYVERLQSCKNIQLTELACKIIYLAESSYTVKEISNLTGNPIEEIIDEIKILEQAGLTHTLPLSDKAYRLQHYLISQQYIAPYEHQNLRQLWTNNLMLHSEKIALISLQDESEFTFEDCNEIVESIVSVLHKKGIKKGDRILLCSKSHTEAILLFWACMQRGIVIVPINTQLPKETVKHILKEVSPKLCFINQDTFIQKSAYFNACETIVFDEEEEGENAFYFSEWLDDAEEIMPAAIALSDRDHAVILYTSGSTGIPKGVQLSQGNLFRSGRHISETFHWQSEDRFFALGGLDSMSGLRNAVIAPLHVGASVVVPKENSLEHLFLISEAIEESQSSILAGNPAMLRQMVKYSDKINRQLDCLKKLICTGNNLTDQLRIDFKKHFKLDILNYYGLTETTGICTAQAPFDSNINSNTIGKPIGCIAQIVDENGHVLEKGQEGELRIFGENIMQGYFKKDHKTAEAVKNGWFYTQDLASYTNEGNIILSGRKRNIIKTAQEDMVYLSEVENFIRTIDHIEDVAVCAHTIEDTEKMLAFVVANNPPDLIQLKKQILKEIQEHLGTRKVPGQIHFIQQLPYTENGKLLTKELLNELY